MLSQHYTTSNTAYFPSMPKGRVVEVLLEIMEKCLNEFPKHLQVFEAYDEFASELFFNNEFSHTFQIAVQQNGYSGCTFHDESASQEDLVGKQKKKGIPPRVDLGVRLAHSRDRILLIEGKRLHDPSDKQYVSGKTGGITRFKQEQHGADVEVACMVGYVQDKTFSFWHEKINSWIRSEGTSSTNPNWDETDCLMKRTETAEHLSHCSSQHGRVSKIPIKLHHFWVKVI